MINNTASFLARCSDCGLMLKIYDLFGVTECLCGSLVTLVVNTHRVNSKHEGIREDVS